jgi:hypothetical protein
MVHRNAREILEGGIHYVIIIPRTAHGRIRVKSGDDWIVIFQ